MLFKVNVVLFTFDRVSVSVTKSCASGVRFRIAVYPPGSILPELNENFERVFRRYDGG